MKAKWWFLIVLLFLVVVFTIQNYSAVTLKFLFWSVNTSEAILVYVTLIIGVIVGVLLSKKSQ